MATHPAPVGPFPPGADPDAYDRLRRRVLWRLPMGLYLLGSASADRSRLNLMTLNWAMQVSIQPKQIVVSVESSAVTHELIAGGQCFALSLVARRDRAEVRKFVKPATHDAGARTLNAMAYRTAVTGAPIAGIAAAWLDCEVRQQVPVGSHTLFVGEVVAAGAEAGADGTGEDADGTGEDAAGARVVAAGVGADAPAPSAHDEELEILRMEDTRMSYGG